MKTKSAIVATVLLAASGLLMSFSGAIEIPAEEHSISVNEEVELVHYHPTLTLTTQSGTSTLAIELPLIPSEYAIVSSNVLQASTTRVITLDVRDGEGEGENLEINDIEVVYTPGASETTVIVNVMKDGVQVGNGLELE